MVQVSVIGSGTAHEANAEEVGRLLAGRGATVVTGGLGEVMAAASRGAKDADGRRSGSSPARRERTRTRGSITSSSRGSDTAAISRSSRRATQ